MRGSTIYLFELVWILPSIAIPVWLSDVHHSPLVGHSRARTAAGVGAAFGVMTLGLVVTAIPLLGNQATVLWTFYPPMKVEWTFYGWLTLVVVATWLVALTLYRTYAVLAGAAPRCMDAPGSVHVIGHLRHVDHRLTRSRCRNALPAHSMVPRMGERHRSPPGADALLVGLGGTLLFVSALFYFVTIIMTVVVSRALAAVDMPQAESRLAPTTPLRSWTSGGHGLR
jgi:hypothetical protein